MSNSRVVHVSLKFTRNEMDRLQEAAEIHGSSIDRFIRMAAIEKAAAVDSAFRKARAPSTSGDEL